MTHETAKPRHSPQSLRAITHPIRVAILRTLASGEPANVRMIAEHIAQPANSVSFHLRQLEKYSYILRAELPEGASKRESWWKINQERSCIRLEDLGSEETMQALLEMLQTMYSHRASDMATAIAAAESQSREPDSGTPEIHVVNIVDVFYLTKDQPTELHDELRAVYARWKSRSNPDDKDAMEYEVCVDIFPHLTRRELT